VKASVDEFIRRQVVTYRPTAAIAALVGTGFALLGALIRWLLEPIVHGEVPYISFFPMLLIASLLAGSVAGVACLATSTLLAVLFLIPPFGMASVTPSTVVFLVFGAMVIYVAGALRRSLIKVTEAADQERVFTLELQHRVKNTLAVIQSLAAQKVRTSPTLSDFRRNFTERLIAVADAHNVLSEAAWRTVSLRSVAERVLSPIISTGRVEFDGPEVWLVADQTVNLAVSLNELATNAIKHGALSTEAGRVDLRWSCDADLRRVTVQWLEKGGPPVAPPPKKGFGMRLLTRGVGDSSAWRPTLDLRPEGLSWQVVFDAQASGGPQHQQVMAIPAKGGARSAAAR
jgi:two-component sensor histidine kinase